MVISGLRILLLALFTAGSAAGADLPQRWPDGPELRGIEGREVTFRSSSPFVLVDARPDLEVTWARGTLFVPEGASTAAPVPAIVLLHGSGGVRAARELTYARQFAAMGVAALVLDAFAARRDRWSSFIDRVLNVTETMMMADAYAALDFLAGRPEVDARRIALMGFSYGAMVATYTAFETVADRIASSPNRFSAHIAFYGPCIVEFANERTTGAPVLMAMGGQDKIVDIARCRETAAELERGGSPVELIVYPGAYHQWDGGLGADWSPPRGLAGCRLEVEADGTIRDRATRLSMAGYYSRGLILQFCSDEEGYTIRADAGVRAQANAAVASFLNAAWAADAKSAGSSGPG